MKHYAILFVLLLQLSLFPLSAQGLRFAGQSEAPIDGRTSLAIYGNRISAYDKSFSISFSCKVFDNDIKGYILRVKDKKTGNVFHLYFTGTTNKSSRISLNLEGSHRLISLRAPFSELNLSEWRDVSVTFNLEESVITLSLDGTLIGTAPFEFGKTFKPQVFFGKSENLIDSHSFSIRDLVLKKDGRETLIRLDETRGKFVHDSHGWIVGRVSNPKWMTDNLFEWKEVYTIRSTQMGAVNFDRERHQLLFCTRDTLTRFNLSSNKTENIVFTERCPVSIFLGSSFIDSDSGDLFVYEAFPRDTTRCRVAVLHQDATEWERLTESGIDMQIHHHSGFWTGGNGRAQYVIGGFGNLRYNGSVFRMVPEQDAIWETVELKGDKMCPRYFTCSGYDQKENKAYIYGGMGNLNGDSSVGHHYLYDCFKIDLNNGLSAKLWEIKWKGDDCVPVKSMILDGDGHFYTLCYRENISLSSLQLYRFNISDGSIQALGSQIPIRSDAITTNADLFYDAASNELIATVLESEDDVNSNLKAYTLSFPPISKQQINAINFRTRKLFITCSVLLALLLAASLIWTIRVSRKKKAMWEALLYSQDENSGVSLRTHAHPYEGKANTIRLFGGFYVTDKNGRDISYLFSETIRKVLCLLFEYHSGDGISSKTLGSLMWPDKEDDKVKNSKGVALNQLRKALSDVSGIEVVYDNGMFKLVTGPELHCDYLDMMSDAKGDSIIDIATQGHFLPFMEDPLFDRFRSRVEDKLIKDILAILIKREEKMDWVGVVHAADAIFTQDPLNEEAFMKTMKALKKIRLIKEATLRYQNFTTEYRLAYGTEYKLSFKSLLKRGDQ